MMLSQRLVTNTPAYTEIAELYESSRCLMAKGIPGGLSAGSEILKGWTQKWLTILRVYYIVLYIIARQSVNA